MTGRPADVMHSSASADTQTARSTGRPEILGRHRMVSASNYLAAAAAAKTFMRGGNAIDAGVAAGFALNVVERHCCDVGGVAPILIYTPTLTSPMAIDGLGTAPAAATPRAYRERYGADIPEGLARSVVPAALDAWLAALARFGRLALRDVLGPAIELAEGFPVQGRLAKRIAAQEQAIRKWPANTATFLPKGRPPVIGEELRQPDLAAFFRGLVAIESSASSAGRDTAIRTVREAVYRGEIAREIGTFVQREGGLLSYEDIASYSVTIEPAARASYRGYDVFSCGAWSQGPVVPMTLKLLEGTELRGSAHNSPDHLHRVVEALKLAFADREAFFGDPKFIDVPLDALLSDAYAAERRGQIDMRSAASGLPPPGDPWRHAGRRSHRELLAPEPRSGALTGDTSFVCTFDDEGNAFSATPSDPGLWSPIVPGIGIAVSTRGSQFWLDERHPAAMAAGKRPRLTPNPGLLMLDGQPHMPFGCPGGDAQAQAMVQVASNIIDFDMNVQEAIEAPRATSWSFPNSFWPHVYEPGLLCIEGRISAETRRELARRGHLVQDWPEWTSSAAGVCAIRRIEGGTLAGGADPRIDAYAIGW